MSGAKGSGPGLDRSLVHSCYGERPELGKEPSKMGPATAPSSLDQDEESPGRHVDPCPWTQKTEVFGSPSSWLLQPQGGSRLWGPLPVSPETDRQTQR